MSTTADREVGSGEIMCMHAMFTIQQAHQYRPDRGCDGEDCPAGTACVEATPGTARGSVATRFAIRLNAGCPVVARRLGWRLVEQVPRAVPYAGLHDLGEFALVSRRQSEVSFADLL